MKKGLLLLPFLVVLTLTSVVFSAGIYRSDISIADGTSTDRVGVSTLVDFGVAQAVDYGYINEDGMDTRMFEGSGEESYMVSDDWLGVLSPVLLADQERVYRFETGYTPYNESFGVIVGKGGYITTPDDD